MSLLDRVTAVLNGAGMAHALIGAAALAAHGVARSTIDHRLRLGLPAAFYATRNTFITSSPR